MPDKLTSKILRASITELLKKRERGDYIGKKSIQEKEKKRKTERNYKILVRTALIFRNGFQFSL